MRRTEIERLSAGTSVSADRLEAVLEQIQERNTRIDEYLDMAWHADTDDRLLADTESYYVFAVRPAVWDALGELLSLTADELTIAKNAHTVLAEDALDSVSPDSTLDECGELDLLVLGYPENWQYAREMFGWHMGQLAEQGLTPVEILDYWMVEKGMYTSMEWSNRRGVSYQDVRENVYTALEKLADVTTDVDEPD